MYTDIHSHIIPDVDDGPKTLEESLELIENSAANGTENIVATPHFYASRHNLNDWLEVVNRQFALLKDAAENKIPNVKLYLGAEVRYFNGISACNELDFFCFENTHVLLLELDYLPISEKTVEEIEELYYRGYTVVLAHIERYYKLKGFSKLKPLILSKRVKIQINASSFFESAFSKIAVKLIKKNMVDYIAGDMHSVEQRPSKLKEAYECIEKKFGKVRCTKLIQNSFNLIGIEEKYFNI